MTAPVIKLIDATSPDAIKIWADKIYAGFKDLETRLNQIVISSVSSTPSGPAGGVLSGTYPDPAFAVDMATQAELNVVEATIPTLANSVLDGDPAGGVLSGSYPNPGFAVDMATQAELDALALASGGTTVYPPLTVPAVSDFTWVNQGSATAVNLASDRGVFLYAPSNGAAQNARMLTRALPAASNYHVDIGLMPLQALTQYSIVLFALYDSVSGKFVSIEFVNAGSAQQIWLRQTLNPSSAAAGSYFGPLAGDMMPWSFPFLRFEDDGTNRILSWANDGENYLPLYSQSRTEYMTPDRAFVAVNPFDKPTGVTIKHWFQE